MWEVIGILALPLIWKKLWFWNIGLFSGVGLSVFKNTSATELEKNRKTNIQDSKTKM